MTTPHTPVVFIHGLWLHATSWTPWLELFGQAGYVPVAPGWPNEPDLVYCKHCEAILQAALQLCSDSECPSNNGKKKGIPVNARFCPRCGKPTGAK